MRCLRSMATSFETELAEICQVSPVRGPSSGAPPHPPATRPRPRRPDALIALLPILARWLAQPSLEQCLSTERPLWEKEMFLLQSCERRLMEI